MTIVNKLKVLCWAVESIGKEYSEDVVEFIQEEIIPDVEKLENQKR